MKLIESVLIGSSLLVAYGIGFYYHTPELSIESKKWLASAEAPFDPTKKARLEQISARLDELKVSRHGTDCYPDELTAKCYLASKGQPDSVEELESRQLYREIINLMPYVPDPAQGFWYAPAYHHMFQGARSEYYLELRQGELDQETVRYYLSHLQRWLEHPESTLEAVIALALHNVSLVAINLSLGVGQQDLDLEGLQGLIGVNVSLEKMVLKELRSTVFYINQTPQYNYRNKENWFVDHQRMYLQNQLSFFEQEPLEYWRRDLELDGHWYAELTEWLIVTFSNEEHYLDKASMEKQSLDYLDYYRAKQHHHLVLLALANVYQGATIEDHGIEAPEMWRWEWKPEELELCLELRDDVTGIRELNEGWVLCLPHVQLQLAALQDVSLDKSIEPAS